MAPRFSSIVVAADSYQDFDRVAAIVSALAAKAYVRVEVVARTVSDPAGSSSADRELERRIAAAGLEAATSAVLPDEFLGHVGNRGGALLVVATTTWASSGIDRLEPVAEDVLGRLVQPVLVVGPSCGAAPQPSGPPVLAVDGSAIADTAVPVVGTWVRTFRSPAVRVVEVVPPTGFPIPADQAATHVHRYVDALAGHHIAATGDVVRGDEPARELVDFADTFDHAVLVVTSPRWAGEPSHWFHTTRRLIRRSRTPVLVVPADLAVPASGRPAIPASTSAGAW